MLALQGDFREHRAALERLGATTVEVRRSEQLDGLDGLVIPGGESTTIGMLMREYGFVPAVRALALGGWPVYGSCAGLITLATAVVDVEQPQLALIDLVVRRNAFGRQVHSFEADIEVPVLGETPLRGVFIRAPWIEAAGPEVEILATYEGHPVAARQGRVLVTAFHPELTGDSRVHRLFLDTVDAYRSQRSPDTLRERTR